MDKLVPRDLTVRLEVALEKIHLLPREGVPAIVRSIDSVAECSKKKGVVMPFRSRHGERLERDRQHDCVNLCYEGLGADANIEVEENFFKFKPRGGDQTEKVPSYPPWDVNNVEIVVTLNL